MRPVVSFDLDGVVWHNPFNRGVAPRMRELLRAMPALAGLPSDEADRRAFEAIRELSRARMRDGDAVGAYNWDAIFTEVCRGFGGEASVTITSLYESCCGMEGVLELMPGARDCLERVRAAGAGCVALTNGFRAYQWPVLVALGIADLFDDVVTPDVAGYAKPDPRLYEAIPGLLAHLGDNVLADLLGARRAGVRAIWVDEHLPDALRPLPPQERAGSPLTRERLQQAIERSIYRDAFVDVSADDCLPHAVVADPGEAAPLLERWVHQAAGSG